MEYLSSDVFATDLVLWFDIAGLRQLYFFKKIIPMTHCFYNLFDVLRLTHIRLGECIRKTAAAKKSPE